MFNNSNNNNNYIRVQLFWENIKYLKRELLKINRLSLF